MTQMQFELLWSQEFDQPIGTAPDTESTWTYNLGTGDDGWGNQEHEYYTDRNAYTDGSGNLVITAKRISSDDAIALADPRVEFLSSRLHTHGKVGFQYGRIEARIKMPKGDGSWPAFWMLGERIGELGWPECGEIDIAEVGDIKHELVASLHGPGYCGGDPLTKRVEVVDTLNDEFHTYAIDWRPGKVEWLFDGEVISTKTAADAMAVNSEWVFDQPFFLIVNLAMGGVFVPGGLDPNLNQAELTIDYIRHYSIDGIGQVIKP